MSDLDKMIFDVNHFWKFCRHLRIDTKEKGLVPLTPIGSQRYFIEEIASGMNEGIHTFVCLKGRQLGISTICLALDIYWNFRYPGLQGTLVTDTDINRDVFRATITQYMKNIPKQWRVPALRHNRTQLILKNGSRFIYQVAGTRAKGSLGQGTSVSFIHGTECASWADEEGFASLMATLAETNPQRMYIFESTAKGFNMFEETWTTAKRSISQKAIFVGWWRNELYRVPRGSVTYLTYWDGRMNSEERKWASDVKKIYGYDIDDEQIAWWRWKTEEIIKDDMLMQQNFPWTEHHAFIISGSQFFTSDRLTVALKEARKEKYTPHKYLFSDRFDLTELHPTTPQNAELKIWEFPVPHGVYAIGADPAYGSSDWADRFALSIFRCYSDGMEQVAEYATDHINMYQFAWVIAHLAGAYKNTYLNLEINGPGQAVYAELQNIKRMALAVKSDPHARGIYNVQSGMKEFNYRRVDAMGAGGFSKHWVSTANTKERMLNGFKDNFERGLMIIRSTELLSEMQHVVREDGHIEARGKNKDDRVIAAGLASEFWNTTIRVRLAQRGETLAVSRAREGEKDRAAYQNATSEVIRDYLRKVGLNR